MQKDLIASKSIEVEAEPSMVWNVLTNPKLIKEYLYGTETITDWKVGSEIIFQGEYKDKKYRDMGIIQENVLYKLLSYSFWSNFSGLENKSENYSLITYHLEDIKDKKTKFIWTQKGHIDEQSRVGTENAIGELLEKIKEIAEK